MTFESATPGGGFATIEFPTVAGVVFDTLTAVDPIFRDTLYVVARSPAPPLVLFSGAPGGLFSVLGDGTGLTNLSQYGGTGDVHPHWSPDRSRLAFTFAVGGAGTENQLLVATSDGSTLAFVTTDSSTRRPRFSPDGRHLAFECGDGGYPSSSQQDVCTVADVTGPVGSLDGSGDTGQRVVVTDAIAADLGGSGAFAWNPLNANQMAVVRDSTIVGGPQISQIWLVDFDGSGRTVLTPQAVRDGLNEPVQIIWMDWAPNGSFIVFEGQSPNQGRSIYRVDVASGSVTQLTTGASFIGDYRPMVSPDNSRIIFGRTGDGWQLWQMAADGSGQFAMTPYFNFNVDQGGWDWSPDGTEIVLTDGTLAAGDVAIAKIPTGTTDQTYVNDVRLVGRLGSVAPVTDIQPSWRP
jgi:Tol biopolymer transport system component